MRLLRILPLLLLCPVVSKANFTSEDDRQTFISTYADIAVMEMQRTGIPASITLGQAILESSWGQGTIAKNANNFFCIKCFNGWTGPTFDAKDDEPGLSCFRKYESILRSFHDHSDFLKDNVRYQPLFKYAVTDYKNWSEGLKDCGYATDEKYADKLIGIIENYGLWIYDYAVPTNHFDVLRTDEMEEETSPTEPETEPEKEPTTAPAEQISTPEVMEIPGYRWESLPSNTVEVETAPTKIEQNMLPQQPQKRKIRPILPQANLYLERR